MKLEGKAVDAYIIIKATIEKREYHRTGVMAQK